MRTFASLKLTSTDRSSLAMSTSEASWKTGRRLRQVKVSDWDQEGRDRPYFAIVTVLMSYTVRGHQLVASTSEGRYVQMIWLIPERSSEFVGLVSEVRLPTQTIHFISFVTATSLISIFSTEYRIFTCEKDHDEKGVVWQRNYATSPSRSCSATRVSVVRSTLNSDIRA